MTTEARPPYNELLLEIEIYEALSGGSGIPQLYWHGHEYEYRVMAFELLGPNLENLFNYYSRKFSLKTVLMFADQLIPSLKYIHSKGLIRRDAKPENMLMGDGKQGNKVYIVRDRHRVGEATREADKARRLSNLIWSE